jgi:hypothetical protein
LTPQHQDLGLQLLSPLEAVAQHAVSPRQRLNRRAAGPSTASDPASLLNPEADN